MQKPSLKPQNPNFSSGPCSKRPGWTYDVLKNSPIGRSHRHKVCKERLNEVIELSLNYTPKDQVQDVHILNRGPNLPATLSESDARKNAIEKQHKIHEMEKIINNVSNNINGSTGQKKNTMEDSNMVLLEQKRKDSIPRRLTRMEIEKSLHATLKT